MDDHSPIQTDRPEGSRACNEPSHWKPYESFLRGFRGFLSITAMSGKAAAPCVGVTVTGWAENDLTNACIVSSTLKSLYGAIAASINKSDTTPQLLERLAMSESTYQQFFKIPLAPPPKTCSMSSPVDGLWPNENNVPGQAKRGSFVGLPQVPPTNQTAWNWIINVNVGANEFQNKIQTTLNHRKKILKQPHTPSLPDLTGHQIEQLAIGLYKGFGRTNGPTIWYWVPQCSTNNNIDHGTCTGGTWSWQPNPKPCRDNTNSCVPNVPMDNVIVQVNMATGATAKCEQ